MRQISNLARSETIDQIARQANGSSVATWGRFLLRSAFQPIYAFVDGKLKITAYEGLIRPFENGRSVSPGEFFNSIKSIDRFRVETLTRSLHVLNAGARIGSQASLFLNFDPSVFIDPSIANTALRELKLSLHESSIHQSRVVCEIVESASGSEEALYSFARALRGNGFQIALDDYGAEDSDFSRVEVLKPDIIKFDRGWILKLMERPAGAALLKEMVARFAAMKIRSLFEGLEERWQLDLAQECAVEMVQGFVLARPEIVPMDFDGSQQGLKDEVNDTGASLATVEAPDTPAPVRRPAPFGRPYKPFGRKVVA